MATTAAQHTNDAETSPQSELDKLAVRGKLLSRIVSNLSCDMYVNAKGTWFERKREEMKRNKVKYEDFHKDAKGWLSQIDEAIHIANRVMPAALRDYKQCAIARLKDNPTLVGQLSVHFHPDENNPIPGTMSVRIIPDKEKPSECDDVVYVEASTLHELDKLAARRLELANVLLRLTDPFIPLSNIDRWDMKNKAGQFGWLSEIKEAIDVVENKMPMYLNEYKQCVEALLKSEHLAVDDTAAMEG